MIDEPVYRRSVSLPPANEILPITWPRLVKSSAPLPEPPITVPGAWMIPVSVLITVFRPLVFCDQIATELTARIVPLLVMVLPAPWKLIASALPWLPSASTWPPASTVNAPLVRISMVLPPVPNSPPVLTAVALTVEPLPTWMLALSRNEIALESPTTMLAPACTSTLRPSSAATLPLPTRLG
ncbi:hypothetical protein D3C71_1110450 [compost metagenome]